MTGPGPLRVEVDGCYYCNFRAVHACGSEYYEWCVAYETICMDPRGEDEPPPAWCPLRTRPVLVVLAEKS